MATLKHISSKNSDYTAIEAYLVYQHDEFSGKVILDKQGRPMLRESYLLDTLECGDFSFATACLLANRKYGKNTQHGDIKSHQYIISFDPRDAADNGLTMEKAQALGLKFCEENFPGHPAIVCTHPDGRNHSGNIHVHIVIGSVRTREVERKAYIEEMQERVNAATAQYHELGDSIKAAEQRMAEIAVLRAHIVNYARTRPVYDAYRKAGYSKKFLEEHWEQITLHKAAKTAFDEAELQKLPKVKELDAEFAELLTKKKAAYPAYRKARDEMQELKKAQKNVELFFAEEKDPKEKSQTR